MRRPRHADAWACRLAPPPGRIVAPGNRCGGVRRRDLRCGYRGRDHARRAASRQRSHHHRAPRRHRSTQLSSMLRPPKAHCPTSPTTGRCRRLPRRVQRGIQVGGGGFLPTRTLRLTTKLRSKPTRRRSKKPLIPRRPVRDLTRLKRPSNAEGAGGAKFLVPLNDASDISGSPDSESPVALPEGVGVSSAGETGAAMPTAEGNVEGPVTDLGIPPSSCRPATKLEKDEQTHQRALIGACQRLAQDRVPGLALSHQGAGRAHVPRWRRRQLAQDHAHGHCGVNGDDQTGEVPLCRERLAVAGFELFHTPAHLGPAAWSRSV